MMIAVGFLISCISAFIGAIVASIILCAIFVVTDIYIYDVNPDTSIGSFIVTISTILVICSFALGGIYSVYLVNKVLPQKMRIINNASSLYKYTCPTSKKR